MRSSDNGGTIRVEKGFVFSVVRVMISVKLN